MSSEKTEALTFEEALEELEKAVARLEVGDLTLEESLTLFERGQQLVAKCNWYLEEASLRVEQLTDDGEIVELSSS